MIAAAILQLRRLGSRVPAIKRSRQRAVIRQLDHDSARGLFRWAAKNDPYLGALLAERAAETTDIPSMQRHYRRYAKAYREGKEIRWKVARYLGEDDPDPKTVKEIDRIEQEMRESD